MVLLTLACGCRYKRRGLDVEGHVANSVESEMVVDRAGQQASYLQYRGTIIPLPCMHVS